MVAQRYHASLNDDAIFRDPITIDDYLASRYIAKPVRLLDCDYPVDSASAVIFTAGDRAADSRPSPVFVEAMAYSSVKYATFENIDDMNHNSPYHAASELWKRTELKPADVDCAQLYDGFTIIVFQWLEALGFCDWASRARSSRAVTRGSGARYHSIPMAVPATSAAVTAPTSASSPSASSGARVGNVRCLAQR